jgi:hypothetical protein
VTTGANTVDGATEATRTAALVVRLTGARCMVCGAFIMSSEGVYMGSNKAAVLSFTQPRIVIFMNTLILY